VEVPVDIPFQHVKAFAFLTCDEQATLQIVQVSANSNNKAHRE
jgi:hypothetical protein